MQCSGLVAAQPVKWRSPTGNWTCVACIVRRVHSHWATRGGSLYSAWFWTLFPSTDLFVYSFPNLSFRIHITILLGDTLFFILFSLEENFKTYRKVEEFSAAPYILISCIKQLLKFSPIFFLKHFEVNWEAISYLNAAGISTYFPIILNYWLVFALRKLLIFVYLF